MILAFLQRIRHAPCQTGLNLILTLDLYSHVRRSFFDVKNLLHYTNNPTMSIFRLSLRRCFDSYVAKLQRFGDVKLCSALCCIVTILGTRRLNETERKLDLLLSDPRDIIIFQLKITVREFVRPSVDWSVKYTFFSYKNHVYKNVEAQISQSLRTLQLF